MLGKLKPSGVGAAATALYSLHTIYPLLRGSIGGCLSIVLLRKLHSEVLEKMTGIRSTMPFKTSV